MTAKLQQYFLMIRTKDEILENIYKKAELKAVFSSWTEAQQEEFLNFCSGVRGVKMLYDSFFKEIMNPDTVPERLENLLSLILGQEIHILRVLPNEAVNITDNKSLLVMDIVVEMVDGSIANIEMQKIGYAFPGQRCACYSADLLLRQYKRIKKEKKERGSKFSYRDIKNVYTIVFFEKSTADFRAYPDEYIHRAKQRTDTGLELDFLQEFVLIPLDIFKENYHNKGITNKLEAWLTFFTMDQPERIIGLIQAYPEFKSLYEDVYTLCLDMEKVMGMFSEELRELDRNTVDYMIDEMQNTIDIQQEQIDIQKERLQQCVEELNEKDVRIRELEARVAELKRQV